MSFLQRIFFLKLFQKDGGFNLIELLTTVGVVGTLTVVGIKSYQSQTNKARSAEAKHSLSYIYTAEQNFHDTWSTYHENLTVIGAVPSGSYHYDIGFSKNAADISKNDGLLRNYPLPDSLDVVECTNFDQICRGNCLSISATRVGSAYSAFFDNVGRANCRVTGGLYFKDHGMTEMGDAKAEARTHLKRWQTGQLASDKDLWSIDNGRTVTHEVDGTE